MAALGLVGILSLLVLIGCLICLVIVLIKQFQDAGALHGVIGIVTCGIWTFIWGWMNGTRLNIKTIMMIWTLLIIVRLVLMFAFGAAMSIPGMSPVTR